MIVPKLYYTLNGLAKALPLSKTSLHRKVSKAEIIPDGFTYESGKKSTIIFDYDRLNEIRTQLGLPTV